MLFENQEKYSAASSQYGEIKLDSTMYLAYRDLEKILQDHLFSTGNRAAIRLLDYGCGPGVSTSIVHEILARNGYAVEIYGVDVNPRNIEQAAARMPSGRFYCLEMGGKLHEDLRDFDLVLCNFVLLENRPEQIQLILGNISSSLSDTGIAVITNCTAKVYNSTNKWYSLGNKFIENSPSETTGKLEDAQVVKLELTDKTTGASFVVTDFFYSGKFYRDSYAKANLTLVKTLKPIGKTSDPIAWCDEKELPPYKIHVLSKSEVAPTPTQQFALYS